jgi:hypothetical protein
LRTKKEPEFLTSALFNACVNIQAAGGKVFAFHNPSPFIF